MQVQQIDRPFVELAGENALSRKEAETLLYRVRRELKQTYSEAERDGRRLTRDERSALRRLRGIRGKVERAAGLEETTDA